MGRWGGGRLTREGELNNFLPLKRGRKGLIRGRGLIWGGGDLIEDLPYVFWHVGHKLPPPVGPGFVSISPHENRDSNWKVATKILLEPHSCMQIFLPLSQFEKSNSSMMDHELLRNNGSVYSFAFKRKLTVHFFFSFLWWFVCLVVTLFFTSASMKQPL